MKAVPDGEGQPRVVPVVANVDVDFVVLKVNFLSKLSFLPKMDSPHHGRLGDAADVGYQQRDVHLKRLLAVVRPQALVVVLRQEVVDQLGGVGANVEGFGDRFS